MLITGQSNTDWSSVTDSISHPVPAAQPSGPGPGRCSLGSKLQRVCSGRAQHRGRQPGEGSGARTHKTAGEEGLGTAVSHCRRDINARQHRPARLYILHPGLACSSQGACSERWPALQHAGCTAVHSPATATTKIHSADNPSNWIHHSHPLLPPSSSSSCSGLSRECSQHFIMSGSVETRDDENCAAHAMTITQSPDIRSPVIIHIIPQT